MNAVTITRDGGVATVTINNPPVNALNDAVLTGLSAAFAEFGNDEAVRAVVVRGAGERAFVAGADITEFPALRERGESPRLSAILETVQACSQPTIAAIRGYCLGGGLELAMACDIRIAAADARLGQPEIKLGLLPGAGGTQRLPRLVGYGRALLLDLTGDPIPAQQAYEWGLVEMVVPVTELEEASLALATRLAAQAPIATRAIKALVRGAFDEPLAEGLAAERRAFDRCLQSDDGAEGVAAFVEKREPRWTGR